MAQSGSRALAPAPSTQRKRARRSVAIVFVHGTWGRGFCPRARDPLRPRWFEEGSSFERCVEDAMREHGLRVASIDRVEWSGSNAILHRDHAARLLAERLDALHAARPATLRLVIGHSHGGNVALRAFAHVKRSSGGIHVATIATPFVEVLGGASSNRETARIFAAVAVSAIAVRLFGAATGAAPLPFPMLMVFAMLVATVVVLPLAIWLSRRHDGFTRRVEEASAHAAYRTSAAPTLVLRGFDDEASLTLGLGAVATRLSHLSSAGAVRLGELVHRLLMVTVGAAGLLGLVSLTVAGEKPTDALLAWLLDVATAVGPYLAVAAAGFALVEGAAPAVFGRELFLTYLDVQVNSHSVPDAGEHLRAETLAPDAADNGLRHALYTHGDCAARIAGWFAGEQARAMSSTGTPAPL